MFGIGRRGSDVVLVLGVIVLSVSAGLFPARAAAAAQPAEAMGSRTEVSVGAGLVLTFPFAHAEVRHYFTPGLSLSGFGSGGSLTGEFRWGDITSGFQLWLINTGAELRYHLWPSSWLDPHVGVGGGALIIASEADVSAAPWFWANGGLTLSLGRHLRLDLEVNPVVGLGPEPSVLPVPVARARWVF